MVAWDNAKGGPQRPEKRAVERIDLKGSETKIRLVGDVLCRYVYWVVTNEGRKMPVECLRFIREEEKFNDSLPDPFKELSEAVYKDKPQFAYVCNAIDRADGKIKVFDLKSTIYKAVAEYARNAEYGNPADPIKGYDIIIKKEKTGPLPQNVKYNVMPGRASTPLKEEEKSLELYDLDKIYKRQTYAEQKEWLMKNTALFADQVGEEFKTETAEDLSS